MLRSCQSENPPHVRPRKVFHYMVAGAETGDTWIFKTIVRRMFLARTAAYDACPYLSVLSCSREIVVHCGTPHSQRLLGRATTASTPLFAERRFHRVAMCKPLPDGLELQVLARLDIPALGDCRALGGLLPPLRRPRQICQPRQGQGQKNQKSSTSGHSGSVPRKRRTSVVINHAPPPGDPANNRHGSSIPPSTTAAAAKC